MSNNPIRGRVFQRTRRDGTPYDKWSIRYDTYVNGKRKPHEITNKYDTKTEAVAALANINLEIQNDSHILPSGAKLGDYIEAWVRSRKSELRESAYVAYQGYIAHVKKHLGHMKVQAVKSRDIRRFLADLAEPGARLDGRKGTLSVGTRRHVYSMLRQVFAAALADEEIRVNPVLAVERPKGDKKEFEVWDEDKARAFLEAAKSHELYAAFALDLAVGMRRGELLGLTWGDYATTTRLEEDKETGKKVEVPVYEITIRKARVTIGYRVVSSKPKTKSGTRTIEIEPKAKAILDSHKARQGAIRMKMGLGRPSASDPVFHDPEKLHDSKKPSHEFIHPDRFNNLYERLVADAGVKKIRFHDLRHTCASIALRNGADIVAVSKMLGHKSPSFTLNVYSHLLPGQQKQAAVKVADAIL